MATGMHVILFFDAGEAGWRFVAMPASLPKPLRPPNTAGAVWR